MIAVDAPTRSIAGPFYNDDRVTIWHGDARALPLADASVHLVVTSPPYNASLPYDGYVDSLPWQEYWGGLIEPALRECYRVLVHGGRICVNIANVVRSNPAPNAFVRDRRGGRGWRSQPRKSPAGSNGAEWSVMIAPLIWSTLRDIGFLPRETLTWLKADDPANNATHSTAWGTWCSARNPVMRTVTEPVFIASKGSHAREVGESDLTPAEFKAWTRNCWKIGTTGEQSHALHPATFPIELPRRLIKLYSYVGDTVLDPFLGSGTTIRAAKDCGRRGWGVELSARYCTMAANRARQELMPLEVVL